MAFYAVILAGLTFTLTAAQFEPTLTANSSDPAIVPGFSPDLTVECRLETGGSDVIAVYLLLQRLGNDSTINMALLMGGGIKLLAEDARFSVEGNLEEKALDESFLNLNIDGPVEADAGEYRCEFVYFLDGVMTTLESTSEVSLQALPAGDTYVAPPPAVMTGNCCDVNAAEIDLLWEMINATSPVVSGGGSSPVVVAAPGQCHSAFTATLREPDAYILRSNQVLIFDQATLNYGEAYDVTTGVFTAPCTGLYTFSLTLTAAHATSGSVEGVIRRGEENLARTFTYSLSGAEEIISGHVTTTARLEQGDSVDVFLSASARGNFVGENYSVFTGHFLWA